MLGVELTRNLRGDRSGASVGNAGGRLWLNGGCRAGNYGASGNRVGRFGAIGEEPALAWTAIEEIELDGEAGAGPLKSL